MSGFAFYNGRITPIGEASVPITNRAIFFGDAIYEVFLGKGGKIYQKREHLLRLFANLKKLSFVFTYDRRVPFIAASTSSIIS